MNRNFKLLVATLIAAVVLPSLTYAQFVLSGELRPRAEYRHGFKSPATEGMDAAMFVSQRARLNLNFKNEKMKFGMSLQDVRVWGDVAQLNTSDNSFSLHEAWGEYYFSPSFSVKAGRMELIYDDSRIFGNVDWAQQGRSHDIGLLKFENTKWKAHAGLAYNQDKEQFDSRVYTVSGNYKNLQLLWIDRKWAKLDVSLLFVNNGMQFIQEGGEDEETIYDTKYSQTFGGTAIYKTKPAVISFNAFKQAGTSQSDKDINAFMFGANVNIALSENFNIIPGIEYLSGTSQKDAPENEINSFNPLYGTAHKFNGHMDYYFVGNHLNTVGLQDIFAKVLYKKGKLNAGIDFHFFGAAADVIDPEDATATLSRNLGQEIDFYLGYKFTPDVQLNLGYSQYLTTESIIALKGGSEEETSNWAWVSVSFKPEFLNTAK
ncbi:MAG: alginate export family protein [Lentimicrobium sp.]|nr:alginate export family protein [Lentimicrobium sp.]